MNNSELDKELNNELNSNIVKKLEEDVSLKVRSSAVIVSLEQAIEEIVFNSIDAKATSIVISINLSNLTFEVKDNGYGFGYSNLQNIGEHNCTSKISKLSDLKSLSTFGYRGESLASLSDISSLDIFSTSKNGDNNTVTVQKTFSFGKCEQFKIIDTQQQVNQGTIVRVRDLFKNYPVRRQNLFHPNLKLILKKRIEIIALSFPNIRFSVFDETRSLNILKTPKETSFISYFKHFYGQEMSNKLEFICSEGSSNEKSFYLSGYVSSPQKKGHPNKSFQYFYLNNRIILNTKIHRHINQLYQKFRLFNAERRAHANISKIPKKEVIDSNPVFILFLKCSQLEYERSYEPSSKTFLEFNDWKKPLGEIQNVITKFLTRFRENDTLLYKNNQKRSNTSSVLDVSIFEDDLGSSNSNNGFSSSQIDNEEAEEDGFDLGYNGSGNSQQQEEHGSGLDFQNDEEDSEIVNNSGFLNASDSKRKSEEEHINNLLPDSLFLSEKSPSRSPFKTIISPSKLTFQNISLNSTSPTKSNNSNSNSTQTSSPSSPFKSNITTSSSPTSSPTHFSQNQSSSSQNSIQLAQQFISTLQPLLSSSSPSESPTSSQNNQSQKSSSSSIKSNESLPQFNFLNNNERKTERDEEFKVKKENESNKKLKKNIEKEDINYTDFNQDYSDSDSDSDDTILESTLSPPPKPSQQDPNYSSYFSSPKELSNKKEIESKPITAVVDSFINSNVNINRSNSNNIELPHPISKAIVSLEKKDNGEVDYNIDNKEIVPYIKREPNLLDENHLENYNPTFRDDEDDNHNNNNKANYSLKVSTYREIIDLENDETTTVTTTTTTIKSIKTVTVTKRSGNGFNNINNNLFNQYKVKNEHPLLIKKEDFQELNDNASIFSKSNESNDSLFGSSCLDIVPFEVSDDEDDQCENVNSSNKNVNSNSDNDNNNLNENITPPSSPPQASPLKNHVRKQVDLNKSENESPTKKQRIVINLDEDEDGNYIDTPLKSSQLTPSSVITSPYIKRESTENTGIFSKYFKSNFDKDESLPSSNSNTPTLRESKLLNISTETDLPSTESAFSDDEYPKKKVTFDIDKNQFFSPPQFYYDDQEEESNNSSNNNSYKEDRNKSVKIEQENQLRENKDECPTHYHHYNCNQEEEEEEEEKVNQDYGKIELMKKYNHNSSLISQYFDGRKNPNQESIKEVDANRGKLIKDLLSQKSQEIIPREMLKDFKFITQWDKKFLICEANGIVLILDQHAVSERIKLEILEKKYFGDNKFDLCPMPERSRWSLTEYELELMKIYTKNLEDWGFKWRFNQTSITILQVPMFCLVGLGVNDLREFLYLLENNKGSSSTRPPAARRILATKACRTAIKFGHNLTREACIKLLDELNECNIPFQCAHGRVSIVPLVSYGKLFNGLNQSN